MPQGRRVRVLDPITNAVHSPAQLSPPSSSRTPSPTLSGSTASSSTPPPTPQSLFSTMPLPASKRQIHPAITYTGIPPYLCFDLAFPPSAAIAVLHPPVRSRASIWRYSLSKPHIQHPPRSRCSRKHYPGPSRLRPDRPSSPFTMSFKPCIRHCDFKSRQPSGRPSHGPRKR